MALKIRGNVFAAFLKNLGEDDNFYIVELIFSANY